MLYAIAAVIMIIVDQFIKYLVESRIVLDAIGKDVVRLIPGFIHATNVHNYGAAFSFLEGARWFFIILCIVFVLLVIYVLAKDIINTPLARWTAVIVLAGAVGNCIDRIVCGYVVDMLEFEFLIFGRPFPVFNVADIYITLGAIAFCIFTLAEKPAIVAEKSAAVEAAPEVQAEAEPKKAAKPLLKMPARRSHKKTEIPTFPKRAPAAPAPTFDPNDPFAEWEKRANAPAAPVEETPATHISYTQPAAAEAAAPVEAEPVAEPAPVVEAAPAAPVAPAATAAPAEETAVPESFSLDDILAEFKDL